MPISTPVSARTIVELSSVIPGMVKIMSNSLIGHSWEEVMSELFTPEEIAESNLKH